MKQTIIVLALAALTTTGRGPRTGYQEVKDWPKLPAGVELGEVPGVAVDAHGHVFVFHRPGRGFEPEATSVLAAPAVLEIDADSGRLIASWGAGMFLVPHGITIDDDNNVWLTDVGLQQVFKFSHDGKLLLTLGHARVGGWDATHFNQPTDIAIRRDGSFYVSDGYVNSRVALFDRRGAQLAEWGWKGNGEGEFSNPHGLAFGPGGDIFVADRENSRIQIFGRDGGFKREWLGAKATGRVFAVAVDGTGAIYVGVRKADYDPPSNGVLKLDGAWQTVASIGFGAAGDPVFNAVHDLAIGRDGSIYVAETRTKRVVKLRPSNLDLRQAFTLANEFKEGDLLVGGTSDPQLRAEARRSLAALPIGEITSDAFVDDGVSEAIDRSLNRESLAAVSSLTIAGLAQILSSAAAADWVRRYGNGLRSEVIAAVAKVMSDGELSAVARTIFNPLPGVGTTVGAPHHFGSRIQPNSPGDDDEEILLSICEGLTYGCGDVIIGLNPASDDVETIVRLEDLLRRVVERLRLPTRYCVLSDIVKQTRARRHVPVDVGFQSLAGTSQALAGMVALDVNGILDLARGFAGCYFETGQGSAVTNGAAAGVDMVTLEARAYGVARHIRNETGAWTIVNDVAGFIGPEVFRTARQLERACLEDMAMAKLHGLTMGLDVCATFHMAIAPDALLETTRRIVDLAAPAYLMAVAGNADPMLGYLTTSFREHPELRRLSNRRLTTAMSERLAALDAQSAASFYAAYVKAGGDHRTIEALREEGTAKIDRLRVRGWDLGGERGGDAALPSAARRRIDTIYAQARQALYAVLDAGVVASASPHHVRVRTRSRDREDYLAHPRSGESIRDEDVERIAAAARVGRHPQVLIVISDGLNANALNEHLRTIVPPLRRELAAGDLYAGAVDVVIENGRVRAGYHAGAIVDADTVVHLIGERPGTGLNTLSAYLTYGRDAAGRPRWMSDLDHSATTAVCGIHRNGKPPAEAVSEIVRLLRRMADTRRSGVSLHEA